MRVGNMTLSTSGEAQYLYKGSTGLLVGDFHMEHGDKWSLIQVKTPRSCPKVMLRVGRDRLEAKCSRQQLTALLFGSVLTKGSNRLNKFYEVARKTRGTLITLDEQKLGAYWITAGTQILVDGRNVWLAEDPANEISTYMPKVLATRLRNAQPLTKQPKGNVEAGPQLHETPVARKLWAIIVPCAQPVGSYWVTGSVARAELPVLAEQFKAPRFEADQIPRKLGVYMVDGKSELGQQISRLPKQFANPMKHAKFIRYIQLAPDEKPMDVGGRPIEDIGDQYATTSWSAYNEVECYTTLHSLCAQGFFTSLHTVPKTRGIVLEYGLLDREAGKQAAIGWAKRIYAWLYPKIGYAPKMDLQCGERKAALTFKWPALTDVQRESIRLLHSKPPVLRSPHYAEVGTSRGLCIQRVDYTTGMCLCSPNRAASVATWEPIPYSRLVEWKGA